MKKKNEIFLFGGVLMEFLNATTMVLKTGTVKEPENVLITGFMVGPRSDRWSNR